MEKFVLTRTIQLIRALEATVHCMVKVINDSTTPQQQQLELLHTSALAMIQTK